MGKVAVGTASACPDRHAASAAIHLRLSILKTEYEEYIQRVELKMRQADERKAQWE
jgi:hypothetical protein